MIQEVERKLGLGSLLFDPRSGRCLIGLLGRSFGFLPYSELTFLLDCFDAGSAGVGDLAGFNLLAIVAATLRSMIWEGCFCLEMVCFGAA